MIYIRNDIIYNLVQFLSSQQTVEKPFDMESLDDIFRLVAVLSVTEQDIREAFDQKWKDFEDCVQYITGKNNRMDYIVTVNQKDYEDAQMPVMTPAVWIAMIDHI